MPSKRSGAFSSNNDVVSRQKSKPELATGYSQGTGMFGSCSADVLL